MGERITDKRLTALREKGHTVWSYSRINSFNQCKLGYYLNYVAKVGSKQNIYSYMGGIIHDAIEAFQQNGRNSDGSIMDGISSEGIALIEVGDIKFIRDIFYNELFVAKAKGMKFPNPKIGKSWEDAMVHWLDNYAKIPTKMATEKIFILEIADGIWIHGYIDVIMPNGDGESLDIMDWKTSSKFTGKDLIKSGRQLLLYKLGVEDNFKKDVKELSWYMFKLINVCTKLKNGKVRKTLVARNKWVKDYKNSFMTEFRRAGIEDFEANMYLSEAIRNNNIDNFPAGIKDKFWLEDGYVYYESNEENIQELKDYIVETVKKIDKLDINNMDEWDVPPIKEKDSFFCNNLCGVKDSCPRYQEFIGKLKNNHLFS